MKKPPLTLIDHITRRQRDIPEATGSFTTLMQAIALAGKVIAREVSRAGLGDLLGSTGRQNVQGEEVARLDEFSNEVMIDTLSRCGEVCALASEELAVPIRLPSDPDPAHYAVVFDPLDGSSNIDVAVPVGTIFGVFRRKSAGTGLGDEQDMLQPASDLAAAGYILYGSSTVFVYSTGGGVHGFTLHPSLGEFVLTHSDLRIPRRGKYFSINTGNRTRWNEGVSRAAASFESPGEGMGSHSLRYVGSLVADAHRTLLRGGIFMYPADTENPQGKLRLLYEAGPIGYLVEQAGGVATDGTERILEKTPREFHERTPLVIGSPATVEAYSKLAGGSADKPQPA
ncbi:MAG: class 1 fructose-bisphosphatase [Acidobacteriota bacterium]|nr:class 1 fructose-bisphosphatase [Acidobacteriota bacterium]